MAVANYQFTPPADLVRAELSEPSLLSPFGRVGRLRYIARLGGLLVVCGSLVGIAELIIGTPEPGDTWPRSIILLFSGVLLCSFLLKTCWMIQRVHDFNVSIWFVILALIVPAVGVIFMIIPGTKGPNNYGNPPKPNSPGVWVMAAITILVLGLAVLVQLIPE